MFHAVAPLVWPSDLCHGIRVISTSPVRHSLFVERIDRCLALVAESDRRRYGRIRREIRRIVQAPAQTGAEYYRLLRVCIIDESLFSREPNEDRRLGLLASVLVHAGDESVVADGTGDGEILAAALEE